MRSSAFILALAASLACLPAGGGRAAETRAPRAVPGDEQDLLFFDEARPYRLRLHMQVNGRPFQTGWAETVDHLFRYLDVNGDGVLSKGEASRAPSVAQWRQMRRGEVFPEPDPAPDFAELAAGGADGKVTAERVKAYYRRAGGGPLQTEWVEPQASPDRRTAALFDHLDRNKDGRLSRQELLDAFDVLNRLDTNGDELISPAELAYGLFTRPYFLRAAGGTGPRTFPFQVPQAGEPAGALAKQLLTRYDKNKDGKLSRAEFRIGRAAFDRLDANRDGALDTAELAHWRDLPSDLELIVPLEAAPRELILAAGPDGRPRPLTALAHRSREGTMLLPLGDMQLELARAESGPAVRKNIRKGYEAQVWRFDANKNGFIESRELYLPPFAYVGMLRLADRDRDGKLSRAETSAYLELQEKVFATTTVLTVVDRGRALFELLDANHDGRLSPRELRSAWQRLLPWDRSRAGSIGRTDVPRQFQLMMSHGRPRQAAPQPGAPGGAGFGNFTPQPLARPQGPRWFLKMDRNGDGDVSRNEFLGTDAQFRKIDADGDGLIDAEEAKRADDWFRKKRP